MKKVFARFASAAPTVPVNGGYRAQFSDHHAVLPDAVADYLVAVGGGHYRIVAEDLSFVKPGDRVLLIRDTGLGDVLMLTPLIRRLHEDQGVLVDVLTHERYRCLFDGNPHVHATFALEDDQSDRAVYAYVLDLRLVVENAEYSGVYRHRADAFAAYADVTLHGEEDRRLDYFVSDDEIRAFQERFAAEEKQSLPDGTLPKTIAYVWRASTGTDGNRTWSNEQHHQVLFSLLAAGYVVILLDVQPVVSDTENFLGHPNLIDWSGKLSIRETGAVLAVADAVVTPDTGLFHLAGALGKPTVTYFGAFPVEERHAHTQLNVVNDATRACALAPCRSYRCLNRDANGQSACLAVDPARVVDSVNGFIAALRAKETKNDVASGLGRSPAPTDSLPQGGDAQPRTGSGASKRRRTSPNDLGADPAEHGSTGK